MKMYEISYTKVADKFFLLHEDIRRDYETAIQELMFSDHPERVDVKRIKGKRSIYYRIRLGEWRVIYTVVNQKIVVITTLLAGSRGDIYKKMRGLK